MEIKRKPGRPRIYGDKLGTPSELAGENRDLAQEYQVNLYGRNSNFTLLCPPAGKPVDNSIVATLFRLVA